MPLEQLAKILQDSPLDRDTKLFAIDLITLSDDEHFIQSVMDLILEWKKTDTEAVDTLHQALFALAEEYRIRQVVLEQKQQRGAMDVADQISTNEKMQLIRQKLAALI